MISPAHLHARGAPMGRTRRRAVKIDLNPIGLELNGARRVRRPSHPKKRMRNRNLGKAGARQARGEGCKEDVSDDAAGRCPGRRGQRGQPGRRVARSARPARRGVVGTSEKHVARCT